MPLGKESGQYFGGTMFDSVARPEMNRWYPSRSNQDAGDANRFCTSAVPRQVSFLTARGVNPPESRASAADVGVPVCAIDRAAPVSAIAP